MILLQMQPLSPAHLQAQAHLQTQQDSTNDITIILRIIQILVTIILALYAYYNWKIQQKKLRESITVQEAIKSQIALRLKIETTIQFLFNTILISDEQSFEKNFSFIISYRDSLQEKYIDLVQKLSICEMYWGKEIRDLIKKYESNYNDLQAIISTLQIRLTTKDSTQDEKEAIERIIKNLIELENNTALKNHLI